MTFAIYGHLYVITKSMRSLLTTNCPGNWSWIQSILVSSTLIYNFHVLMNYSHLCYFILVQHQSSPLWFKYILFKRKGLGVAHLTFGGVYCLRWRKTGCHSNKGFSDVNWLLHWYTLFYFFYFILRKELLNLSETSHLDSCFLVRPCV